MASVKAGRRGQTSKEEKGEGGGQRVEFGGMPKNAKKKANFEGLQELTQVGGSTCTAASERGKRYSQRYPGFVSEAASGLVLNGEVERRVC